jgi:hypothetical protein
MLILLLLGFAREVADLVFTRLWSLQLGMFRTCGPTSLPTGSQSAHLPFPLLLHFGAALDYIGFVSSKPAKTRCALIRLQARHTATRLAGTLASFRPGNEKVDLYERERPAISLGVSPALRVLPIPRFLMRVSSNRRWFRPAEEGPSHLQTLVATDPHGDEQRHPPTKRGTQMEVPRGFFSRRRPVDVPAVTTASNLKAPS